jgi:hypothetical protein
MWRSYRGPPIKQSLKRCTLSCPMWLFPSVPSGSSLPTNARHSFSNDDLCAAYEGAANAMRENTSRMVLISDLQGFLHSPERDRGVYGSKSALRFVKGVTQSRQPQRAPLVRSLRWQVLAGAYCSIHRPQKSCS